MNLISECNLRDGGQHFWLPVKNKSGKGMQCYSCPMCSQKIYWSSITQSWVNVTKTPKNTPLEEPTTESGREES